MFFVRSQPVTDSWLGQNQVWRTGIRLKFLPDLSNVDPHKLSIRDRASPASREELLVGDYLARVTG